MATSLNKKKHAHVTKDKEQYNLALKDFRSQIDNAKRDYKDRVEEKLVTGNAKQAWDGLNKMMGRKGSKKQCVDVNKQFVDDLNNHYARLTRATSVRSVRKRVSECHCMKVLV